MSPTINENYRIEHVDRPEKFNFHSKRRVRRQYNPDDFHIADLFTAIRRHDTKIPTRNKYDEIKHLLAEVKDINDVDRNDNNNAPLHVAVSKGHEDIVELLLQHDGIDKDMQNAQGNTPLHLAVIKEDKKIVELLITYKADVFVNNNADLTPLDLARESDTPEGKNIIDVLKRYITTFSKPPASVNLKQDAETKLMEYTKYFVGIYSSYLNDYIDRLENRVQKPGKVNDFFKDAVETLSGGNEAIEVNSLKASSMIGISVLQKLVSSTGSWLNRNELRKLTNHLMLFKKDPNDVMKMLIRSGINVFESFEHQFVSTTVDGSWNRALFKLAEDAVGRSLNYFKENPKEEFNVETITKSIILGKSKTYTNTFLNAPKIKAGHTVVYKLEKSWNTAELYDKTGVVINENNIKKYYSRKKDVKGFDFRLPLDVDYEQIRNSKYYELQPDKTDKYDYVLKLNQKEKLVNELLDTINEEDPSQFEKRIKDTLDENFEELRQDAEENLNHLEEFIGNNFDHLTNFLAESRDDIKKEISAVKKQIADTDEKSKKRYVELKKMLRSFDEIRKSWSNVKESKGFFYDVRDVLLSFTGRLRQLREIHNLLLQKNDKLDVLVISGLSGVGKTELVLKYIKENSKYFNDNVLWINAENSETLRKSISALAKKLKIETFDEDNQEKKLKILMTEIYEMFSTTKSLFVFDSAEDYEVLKDVFPLNFPSDAIEPIIMVTSTSSVWEDDRKSITVYPLEDLEPAESKMFIKTALSCPDDSEDANIEVLVSTLNNFPLALQEAVAYIKQEKQNIFLDEPFTVSSYNKLYFEKTKELLNSNIQKYKGEYHKNTFTALHISLDKIKSEKEIGERALKMLNIMAYFSRDYLPPKIFLKIIDKDNLSAIIKTLQKYSLIGTNKNLIAVHGLIQEVLRIDIGHGDKEEHILESALTLIKSDMTTRENAKKYASHIASLWNYAKEYDELIKKFIVDDLDGSHSKFIHFITESSNEKTTEDIFNKIGNKYPEKLSEVVKVKDHNGWTPLHLAAKNGREKIVKVLLERNAAIDARTEFKFTPLHLAAKNGYTEIVVALVNKNANVNVVNKHKFTPLHFAVKNNHLDVVDVLLNNKNIDINAKAEDSFTPLHLAVRYANVNVVEALLENGADVNVETVKKFTPLHFAALRGNLEIVKSLLNQKAIINVEEERKYTPLHYAVKKKKLKVVELLLKRGANIDAKTVYGLSPLHFAVQSQDVNMVSLLLKYGANVNAKNSKDKFTPLHMAVDKNNKEIVDLLLSKPEIEINAQTSKGNTPLHIAVERNNFEIVKMLIDKGAINDIENSNGKIASDLAKDAHNSELENYIIEMNPNKDDQLTKMITFNKRPGTAGISGQLYEIELAMYYLLEGLKRKDNKQIENFYIASNMEEAENFDDVVFKYTYKDQTDVTKSKIYFIQAKHKDNPEESKSMITLDRLFTTAEQKSTFSLKDYFRSYLNIKKRLLDKKTDTNHPILNSRFEDSNFIIYTNALPHRSFELSEKHVVKIEMEPDDFLRMGKSKYYYHLRLGDNDDDKKEIIDVLKIAAESTKLARQLIKSIFGKKLPEISNLDIIQKYNVALAANVFEIIKKGKGKLRDDFIDNHDNLSDDVKYFRKVFFEEMRRIKEFTNVAEEDLRYSLRDKEIKLADNFGKSNKPTDTILPIPSDVVDETVIREYFKKLKLYIGQESESELRKVIQGKIESLYKVEAHDIDSVFADVEYKMRMWWKEENVFLTENNRFFRDSARISYRFNIRAPMGLFTGRSEQQIELHSLLLKQKAVAVVGMGGVGKSELIRKYISDRNRDYDGNFFWINAESFTTLSESFIRLARETLKINTKNERDQQKNIKDIIKEVYRFFSRRRSLFVFDNAEKYQTYGENDEGIDKFLPTGPNKPYVIITSQDREWGDIQMLRLDVFTEAEASMFIKKVLVIKEESQDVEVKELAHLMQYLPLTLNQAVSYIKIQTDEFQKFTIRNYIEKFKTKTKDLLTVKSGGGYDAYGETVFTNLAVTAERIKDEICGEDALKILDTISYYASDNIPLSLTLNIIEGVKKESKVRRATQLLDQYSMIHRDFGMLSVHRIVQQVIRINLKEMGKEGEVLKSALEAVTKDFDGKTYTSHAMSAWDFATTYDLLIKEFSKLPGTIIDSLDKNIRFEDGFMFGKRSTEVLKDKIGIDNPDTLTALHFFGVILDSRGKYKDAYEVFSEVFDNRLKLFGDKHVDTLETRNYMALELFKLGRYDEARNIFEEVYKNRQNVLGDNDANTLRSRVGVALVLSNKGNYNEAFKEFSEIYFKQKEFLGKNHQDTLTTLNDMALVLEKQGEYRKAIDIYREVCKQRIKLLGSDHPSVIINQNNLAYALKKNGELKESLKIFKELSEKVKFVLGEEHPYALGIKNNMAIVLEELHKYKEALEMYEEVYSKVSRSLSPNHQYALSTKNNIAGVLRTLDRHQEALKYYKEVYEVQLKELGKFHRSTLNTLHNIGNTYLELGDLDTALRTLEEVIEDSKIELRDDHPDVLDTQMNIASVYVKKQMYDEALALLKEIYEKLSKKSLTQNSTLVSLRKTADVLKRLNRSDEGFKLYSDFYHKLKTLQPDSPYLQDVRGNIVDILKTVDINEANSDGETLLHWTVKNDHADTVAILIRKGADINVSNKDGKTPLDLAATEEIKDLLLARRPTVRIPTAEKCLSEEASFSHRRKREANNCELKWEDVDLFNDESKKTRDFSQIKINGNKFLNFIRSEQLSKTKFSQLINLASKVKFSENFKDIFEKINNNEKIMNHLNKVGMVSGITMHAMIAKNALADFLNGDYKGVAINVGFIAGGQGFAKVSQAASLKGVNMAAEGKIFLGRSLQAASPFLARGTSAFVAYDLVNQIKNYRNGTKEAVVGIIGDSIYLGVDGAEIGIEIAEVLSLLEGVSSITGPIGAAVGAFVFVGTDIYMAVKRVDYIDKEIHLTGGERFIEGLRAFIGLHPGKHIEELLKEKQLNNQLMAHGFEYIKQRDKIKNYIFPLGKMVDDHCESVPQSKRICVSAGFAGCARTRIVTRYVQKCSPTFLPYPDNTVILDKKINGIRWSRANPDVPAGSGLLCFTGGEESVVPVQETYFCEYSMGITDLNVNKGGNYSLINLADGKDFCIGFTHSSNIFVVGDGTKTYYGGDDSDTFVLIGNSTSGNLYGQGGTNILDLTSFALEESWIESRFDMDKIIIPSRDNRIKIDGINTFLGRKNAADRIYLSCSKQNNLNHVDGQGGSESFNDHIKIFDGNCTFNLNLTIGTNTDVKIHATKGNFNFIIPYSIGNSAINFLPSSEVLNINSTFLFQHTVTDISSVRVDFNKPLRTINFGLMENFNVTISDAENVLYRFSNGEVKLGAKGNLYLLSKSIQPVEEIIPAYLELGNKLGNVSCFIHAEKFNEIVAIATGNQQILYSDPMHKSHLVNNGNENVFVVTAGNVSFSLPDVNIYNYHKTNTVHTIDLRSVVINKDKDLFIIDQYNDDLLLSVFQELNFIVRLINGTKWYDQALIVFTNNLMKITLENNKWLLTPPPLTFGKDKQVIVITDSDIEENAQIVTARGKGNVTFARDKNNLVLTNSFENDIQEDDICTIIFDKYYLNERKMRTVCIKMFQLEICLKDYAEQIKNAEDVEVLKSDYQDKFFENLKHENSNGQNLRTKRMATSNSVRHSSIINEAVNWVKTATTSLISNISNLFNQKSVITDSFHNNSNFVNQIDTQVDINGTLLLLDVFLAKKHDRKLFIPSSIATNFNSIDIHLILWNIFENSLIEAVKSIGLSTDELDTDYFMMKEMIKDIEKGNYDNIENVMRMYAMKSVSVTNDAFMIKFNQFIDKSLKQFIFIDLRSDHVSKKSYFPYSVPNQSASYGRSNLYLE